MQEFCEHIENQISIICNLTRTNQEKARNVIRRLYKKLDPRANKEEIVKAYLNSIIGNLAEKASDRDRAKEEWHAIFDMLIKKEEWDEQDAELFDEVLGNL